MEEHSRGAFLHERAEMPVDNPKGFCYLSASFDPGKFTPRREVT